MDLKHHDDYISDITIDQNKRILLTARSFISHFPCLQVKVYSISKAHLKQMNLTKGLTSLSPYTCQTFLNFIFLSLHKKALAALWEYVVLVNGYSGF